CGSYPPAVSAFSAKTRIGASSSTTSTDGFPIPGVSVRPIATTEIVCNERRLCGEGAQCAPYDRWVHHQAHPVSGSRGTTALSPVVLLFQLTRNASFGA